MKYPKISFRNAAGHDVTMTWIRADAIDHYQPCTQAYGIVFNSNNEILVIQENGKWQIPGGTPESSETPEAALCRELLEEADVTVTNVIPLGVQMVSYPGNPNTTLGDEFYQYRYVCQLSELHEPSPDPATGIINPRKFVPAKDATSYVELGVIGNAMFDDAIKLHQASGVLPGDMLGS